MLDALIGGIGGIIGNIISSSAADRRFKKMMDHLAAVEAWQKQNLATATNALQSGKQSYEQDPRRAKVRAGWEKLLESPSAFTQEYQSGLKQNAISGIGRDTAEAGRNLAASAQRHGIASSPYAASMQASLFRGASQDKANATTAIDVLGEKTRKADYERVLSGYEDWSSKDLQTEYGYSKDLASLLGSIQYGNSLGLTG